MASKKERQRNYELLRVIAMLMIVCLHYLGKGGLLGDPLREDMNATGYAVWLTEAFCLVAVNVYVLISGYFGAGKNASGDSQAEASMPEAASGKIPGVLQRPLRVWKQVIFYSLFFGLAALAAGAQQFDIYQCFSYVFPIVTEHYWFATAYVVLSLLMPFLDAGMCRLGKNAHAALIFALLLLFCISKTVIPMKLAWDQYGYDTYWFIVLYISGGYLRRYGIGWFTRRWQPIAVYAASSLLVFLSFAVIRFIALRTGKLADLATYGYAYNYFFCYTGAVGLFCAFSHSFDKKKDAVAGRFLRIISGATFGVYLIHEHINVRDKWGLLVDARTALDAPVPLFIIKMLATVLAVYSVCTVIELTRQRAAALIGNFGNILKKIMLRSI